MAFRIKSYSSQFWKSEIEVRPEMPSLEVCMVDVQVAVSSCVLMDVAPPCALCTPWPLIRITVSSGISKWRT